MIKSAQTLKLEVSTFNEYVENLQKIKRKYFVSGEYDYRLKNLRENTYNLGILTVDWWDLREALGILDNISKIPDYKIEMCREGYIKYADNVKEFQTKMESTFQELTTDFSQLGWPKALKDAYNAWNNIKPNSGYDTIEKYKKYKVYLEQKIAYLKELVETEKYRVTGPDAAKRLADRQKELKEAEEELKHTKWILNNSNDGGKTTLTKEAAKKVAQGIWLGTITKNGKLLFGDERRKYLEEKYGKDGAKMVQDELNKLSGGGNNGNATTQKPTPAKTTAKPVSTTKKPTTTTTSPKNTISKAPQSTAKPTTQPSKTVAPTTKPTTAPTTKPTKVPQQTTAPTVKPTTSPDPGGTPASQGVRSRLEDEIKRLREQLEKEQQERINLEQRVQQQQQQAAQQQRQQTVTNYTARPEAAQVVQPEQATVAPTSTPAPAVVIPGSTDSGSTGSGNTGTGGSGTGYDSPSLPNPNAGDSGSGSSSSSSSSSGGFNPIPLGIGLGAAVAGGIGVKAYVDHKKNGKFDDENEDSVTNGNRFWTDEDPNVVHSEEDMLGDDSGSQDVSYQAVENSNPGNDTWNIEENELPDDNSFDLLSENN